LEHDPKEVIESRVALHFRRHGKKEKTLTGQSDREVPLTMEGRQQAVAVGKELNPNSKMSLARGSFRLRAQEVAGRAMLANEESITPEMSMDEISKQIENELKFGKKIVPDPNLDFYEKKHSQLQEQTEKAYGERRTSEFMVHESDQTALETGDLESSTYTRLAGQVAELVKKYAEIGSNFQGIVERNPEKYQEFHNQLERYFGTHNTVSDSFVARVIEKQQGVAAREEFLRILGPMGFNEAEGFGIEITNRGPVQEIVMHVKVKDREWRLEIPAALLNELIEDRDAFNLEVARSTE